MCTLCVIKCRAWSTVLQGGPLKAPGVRGVVLRLWVLRWGGVWGAVGGKGGALGGEVAGQGDHLPLLTVWLFNCCLNLCTFLELRFFLKIACICFKSDSKEKKLKNKTKPKNQKTQHTGLNRAKVPISQETEIYFPEHKVHPPSPRGLSPGSVDSTGNRSVSSCAECEYVGDYLRLPKHH